MADDVQGLTVGSSASFEKQVTDADIASFAEVTGDSNPLHTDSAYAARTRFQQPVAHGMLGAGVISAAIGANLAPGKAVIYLGQSLQFRAPVMPATRSLPTSRSPRWTPSAAASRSTPRSRTRTAPTSSAARPTSWLKR